MTSVQLTNFVLAVTGLITAFGGSVAAIIFALRGQGKADTAGAKADAAGQAAASAAKTASDAHSIASAAVTTTATAANALAERIANGSSTGPQPAIRNGGEDDKSNIPST